MNRKTRINEAGRTMIETIGYIMVMITLTVTVAMAVNSGYHKYECSVIQQQLVDLKKVIMQRYAADGQYFNVKWDDLCAAKAGPRTLMPSRICEENDKGEEECRCAFQKGMHQFDGPVQIGPADCKDGEDYCETFFISFDELPADVCAQLALKAWDVTEGSDLERMDVNGKMWGWGFSPIVKVEGGKPLPAVVKDVSEQCQEGYVNKITWYYN